MGDFSFDLVRVRFVYQMSVGDVDVETNILPHTSIVLSRDESISHTLFMLKSCLITCFTNY